MTIPELKNLIIAKLGTRTYTDGMMNVLRFHYRGNTYRVTTDLNVEKIDGLGDDTPQLEKLLRGEQWDGTGLPPVGTECEVWFKNDDSPKWYNFRTLFQTEQHIVAIVGGEEISYKTSELNSNDVKFRPIRTERDKAIEQMLTIIDCHGVDPLNSAAAIYDAIVAGKIDGLGKVG